MHVIGRHFRTEQLVEIEIRGEHIAAVRSLEASSPPNSGNQAPWIAPGFFDLQINGYGGQEFSSPTLNCEHVRAIVAAQHAFGVTRFLPTLTTASFDTLAHGLAIVAAACEADPGLAKQIPGIHLEGPYISPEDGPRGAHPAEHCRRPDWSEFERLQAAAQGRIRLLTMSAEFPEAPSFIKRAVESGVVVAIGHTAADSGQIAAAVEAGATLSTHLGNGSHRQLRRHPNYIWDQLAEDRLSASLIVDGHHLPPAVVKTFVRAKTPARCILISDLSGLAGLPPGVYDTQMCQLEILADGRLVVAGQDQLLAGASLPIGQGVANVMRYAAIPLAAAVDMASRQPAQLVNCPAVELQAGARADLVVFDLKCDPAGQPSGLGVRSTYVAGCPVFSHC